MHFIKYKDQELPLVIDFAVVKAVCARLNTTLTQFEQSINNPEQAQIIAFEALKRGHKLEGKEFNIKESEVEDILSQPSGLADFLIVYTEDVLKIFTPSNQSLKKN
jgi:hypothetical protein